MLPTPFPWYLLPEIELARFKAIEFFPPKPARMENLRSICIGSKSRTIGDALMLSSLPRRLKERYPELKVLTYPRGFNPVVFWKNPYVDGITFWPDALYGDDTNEGNGHLIHLKERFFNVASDQHPRPEIYLTDVETRRADSFLCAQVPEKKRALPLLVIHPFGQTRSGVLTPEVWARFVREQRDRFCVAQIGIRGQEAIAGCDLSFFAPRKRLSARQLFALIQRADRFIGVDSGPMHVARAFGVPSLVVTDGTHPDDVFKRRHEGPYFLFGNWAGAFLYEDLAHLHVPSMDATGIVEAMNDFALRA